MIFTGPRPEPVQSVPVVDLHGHICENCGTSFTHRKSEIAKGQGFYAHHCPLCGRAVNVRVEIDSPPANGWDIEGWYGDNFDVGHKKEGE